jgi:hypothetical protein
MALTITQIWVVISGVTTPCSPQQPTLEGEVVWHWGRYLAWDIECLHTVMWVREDMPIMMLEDVCNKEIWAGGPRKVEVQPWDKDLTPKPEMGTWGTQEEEIIGGEQEVAPRYEAGWFEKAFPDILKVQKTDPEATWTWDEDYEEWVLDELWGNGEMEDRMA